jgi:hypothetical protein
VSLTQLWIKSADTHLLCKFSANYEFHETDIILKEERNESIQSHNNQLLGLHTRTRTHTHKNRSTGCFTTSSPHVEDRGLKWNVISSENVNTISVLFPTVVELRPFQDVQITNAFLRTWLHRWRFRLKIHPQRLSLPEEEITTFNKGRVSGDKARDLPAVQRRAFTLWSSSYGLPESALRRALDWSSWPSPMAAKYPDLTPLDFLYEV